MITLTSWELQRFCTCTVWRKCWKRDEFFYSQAWFYGTFQTRTFHWCFHWLCDVCCCILITARKVFHKCICIVSDNLLLWLDKIVNLYTSDENKSTQLFAFFTFWARRNRTICCRMYNHWNSLLLNSFFLFPWNEQCILARKGIRLGDPSTQSLFSFSRSLKVLPGKTDGSFRAAMVNFYPSWEGTDNGRLHSGGHTAIGLIDRINSLNNNITSPLHGGILRTDKGRQAWERCCHAISKAQAK